MLGVGFTPKKDVDYGWVVAYAKDRHASALATFKGLDDKASAIITVLGSGAGLLTLGSLAGIAAAKVPPVVVLAALPSMLLAVLAVGFAAWARRPTDFYDPPSIDAAAELAELHDQAGEAAFLRQWHRTLEHNKPVSDRKATHVERATWCMVAAVALLFVPLLVSVAVGPQAG